MRYYSMIYRLGRNKERAVIVKAIDMADALKTAKGWNGMFLSITEVAVDNDLVESITGKVDKGALRVVK